jgi:hypothetical protein
MSSLIVLKSGGIRFLMLLPWVLAVAAAQSPDPPLAEDLLVPGEEEGIPTLPGKPFIDVSFDSFAPKGASLGPLAVTQTVGVAIGFRPLKYFQVDAFRLNVILSGMASDGRQTYVQFSDGSRLTRQIEDSSLLITTGARVVLPVWRDRLLFSAGGGWAGLFVSEQINSPGSYSYDEPLPQCYSCRSRHGWGPTTVAEVVVFPNPARGLGFGFHVRTVQIYSDGISLRKPPSPGANDRFLMIGGTVSIRFGH